MSQLMYFDQFKKEVSQMQEHNNKVFDRRLGRNYSVDDTTGLLSGENLYCVIALENYQEGFEAHIGVENLECADDTIKSPSLEALARQVPTAWPVRKHVFEGATLQPYVASIIDQEKIMQHLDKDGYYKGMIEYAVSLGLLELREGETQLCAREARALSEEEIKIFQEHLRLS